MIYVLDKAAAEKLLRNADAVKKQGIELDDLS
jgi:hypothetical protein